ncbi:MAG: flagellin [Verrucomicrobiota bacterium]
MSVVINSNASATSAANNLAHSNAMLQKSLNRLSSGSKIIDPSDDAGGLAVSMKLTATINRTQAVNTNIANAQSFLQTQDGALSNVTRVLDRMSELKILSQDVTKNSTDTANYNTEFQELQNQLNEITAEQFNGVSLFTDAGTAASLSVFVSESGSQTVDIDQGNLENRITTDLTSGSSNLTATDLSDITDAIENVAILRATNGAQMNRLSFASEMLTVNQENLEAANSRIVDVDVAAESTRLARYNVLVQAGSSMLTQANASSQVALRLLG